MANLEGALVQQQAILDLVEEIGPHHPNAAMLLLRRCAI